MISYLRVILNPDDRSSLLRVINARTRGIGKGTIDTLENIALETGLSLWGAIGEAMRRQLLPPRALAALKSFQQLIEDGRAMLGGNFAEQLAEREKNSVGASAQPPESPEQMWGQPPLAVQQGEALPSNHEADSQPEDATAFDPTEFGNFSFDFGAAETTEPVDIHASVPLDSTETPTTDRPAEPEIGSVPDSFPTPTVNTADLLKFLIDRTGYIKLLEEEDTPEAFSRIENLRELVNAAMDSRDRAETLDQFLDHAALVADADDYDARAQITLMSLHAAKGLEFPLVFLSGLEEGLFPHSRTMLVPEDIEEERRLCYVGMTRAMDQLILTRAVYRRRYGTDLPEASVPSRFLEEVPAALIKELGRRSATARVGTGHVGTA